MKGSDFFAKENPDLLGRAIAKIEIPEGISIRMVRFETDLAAIGRLSMDDADTIDPRYGMTAEDCSNELTLIACGPQGPIGQISADFEMSGNSMASLDLHVSGIFVDDGYRGKGVGRSMALAMLHVAEDWRRSQATALGMTLLGDVDVVADTEPHSGGSALEALMQEEAGNLSDEACKICPKLNADLPEP